MPRPPHAAPAPPGAATADPGRLFTDADGTAWRLYVRRGTVGGRAGLWFVAPGHRPRFLALPPDDVPDAATAAAFTDGVLRRLLGYSVRVQREAPPGEA